LRYSGCSAYNGFSGCKGKEYMTAKPVSSKS
jgi:hypothetical protein